MNGDMKNISWAPCRCRGGPDGNPYTWPSHAYRAMRSQCVGGQNVLLSTPSRYDNPCTSLRTNPGVHPVSGDRNNNPS